MNQLFYKQLFEKCRGSTLTLTTLPGNKIRHYKASNLEKFIAAAEKLGETQNTYINVCPRRKGMQSGVRGGVDDIMFVPAIWSDIDVAGPAHTESDLPPDKDTAIETLNELPIKPTFIVDSGYGVYAYWVFNEPLLIDSVETRDRISGIVTGYGNYLMQVFREHGWKLDNVFDLPRMLRAPGSLNHKLDTPIPCNVISADGPTYNPEDFMNHFIKPEVVEYEPFDVDESKVGSADRIMENCSFAKKLLDDPNGVTEPEWMALCSNIALVPDGAEKFHEWSSPYCGYSESETNYKVKRCRDAKKPCTCSYIKDKLGFACPQGGCGVKAPVVFSLYTKDEQLQMFLEKDSVTVDDFLDENTVSLAVHAKANSPGDFMKLKEKAKKAKVGLRDYMKVIDNAASKMATTAAEDFQIEPRPLDLKGIDLNGAVEPFGYQVSSDQGIVSVEYNGGVADLIPVSPSPVTITRRLENIDNGQETYELAFLRNNRWKHLCAARSTVLNKSSIIGLADNGFPISSINNTSMINYLLAYESANNNVIPFTRSINRIGWVGDEFFPCSIDSEIIYETDDSDEIVSAIIERGSYDIWLELASRLRDWPFARAIMAASFASPLLEILQNRVIILHIWHSSRSGKTAALKFALSIWGDPMRLMGNFNSTAVGLERRAGTLKHLPLGLDELQVLNEKRLSPALIVYSLGNGFGKTRGAKQGGLQDIPTWRNCIISTGEQPLATENSMDGVQSRVLELYGPPIEDETMGRTVHQISEQNYGFAGRRYIEYLRTLLRKSEDKIKHYFNSIRGAIQHDYGEDPGPHLDNVAVLALADMLAAISVFDMDEEESAANAIDLGKLLLTNTKSLEKEDIVERAWQHVCGWISTNHHMFTNALITSTWGDLLTDGDNVFAYVIASLLKKELTDAGFSYSKSIRGFKERGYIRTFYSSDGKESHQCQRKVNNTNTRVVCLILEGPPMLPEQTEMRF